MQLSLLDILNNAIAEWFDKNKSIHKVPAKELMPLFIERGVFTSDHKDGLPIRTVLRSFDKGGKLNLIPAALAERKAKNTNWYFVRIKGMKSLVGKQEKPSKIAVEKVERVSNKKSSFQPIVDNNSRLLILGSLPGAVSLARGQYYANSNNHFWKIMNAVYSDMPESYEDKCKWLLQNGIAIWDVIAYAERNGSLDSAINKEEANDFVSFFKKYPNITTVCFNGTKAQAVYLSHVKISEDKQYILLPSSSSARAMRIEDKIKEWKKLLGKTLRN